MNENTTWIATLPELLKECNARLGWTQIQFAVALGKDPSDMSKILSGKTARPHDETLEAIARVYQQAGLDISLEQLVTSRDAARGGYANPYNYPPHWIRLMNRIMVESQDLQDWFFERWSHDHERVTTLIERQKRLGE